MGVVVSKIVVVFLSAFNYWMGGVPLYAVVLIFLVVGLAMFLIPVIPGVPVYVCAGVLIPNAMMSDEERADAERGFVAALARDATAQEATLEASLAEVYGVTTGEVVAAIQGAERGVQDSLDSAGSAAAAASESRSAEAPSGDGMN